MTLPDTWELSELYIYIYRMGEGKREGKREVSVREDPNPDRVDSSRRRVVCDAGGVASPLPFPSRPLRPHAHAQAYAHAHIHAHDTGTWICTIYGVSDQGATLTNIKYNYPDVQRSPGKRTLPSRCMLS